MRVCVSGQGWDTCKKKTVFSLPKSEEEEVRVCEGGMRAGCVWGFVWWGGVRAGGWAVSKSECA